MSTRRTFLRNSLGAGATLLFGLPGSERAFAQASTLEEERNKIAVARSEAHAPPPGLRAPDYQRLRGGLEHLSAYGRAHKLGDQSIRQAFPDRRDRVDRVPAEGNRVWMLFRLNGTNTNSLYGMPPSNQPVQAPELGRMTFIDGQWKTGWYFGDELGMLLQLGQPNLLAG